MTSNDAKYICKYCGRSFPLVYGYSIPYLAEHLLRTHKEEANDKWDLYLSDLIKECYEYKGGKHD